MAQLSINGLTRVTDPDPARDYSIYFHSDWSVRPPVLRHEADDTSDPTMFNGGNSTISEFEVWGSPASSAAALHVSASAASHSDSGTAVSKTLDRNLSTRWSYSGVGEWVQYDFGSLKSVTSVQIAMYNGTSRVQYFDILARRDTSSDFVRIYRGQSSGTTVQLESYDVPNVAARQIRIVGRGGSDGNSNGFTEVSWVGY